jgi:hypothetical protein
MADKIKKIVQDSYKEFRLINSRIKLKFSDKILLKGKKSEFDSVDIITFLTMVENNFEKEFGKKLNLLDENFFFKYETLNIKNIFDYIKKNK